jgi:integrase
MPKGVRKSNQGADLLVAPGATHLPTTNGALGDPLPAGIAVRSVRGVQIEFAFDGKRRTETVPGRPTVEAVRAAGRLRDGVLKAIELRAFDYAAFFPDSRFVRQAVRAKAEVERAEVAVAGTTMGELFTDFLARFIKDRPGSHNTWVTHTEVVRSHLRAEFGHRRPVDVTSDHLIDFRHALRAKKLSDTRISNILTPLRGAIALAMERYLIDRDPFSRVSPTKPRKQQVVKLDEHGLPSFDEPLPEHIDRKYDRAARAADPFDAAERESILRAAKGQVRNLYVFAFWTGLRTGELIALRWCDVDWVNGRVCIRLSFSKATFTPTKGKRARWVPLLPPALEALEYQKAHTFAFGRWVFNNPATDDRWSSSERLRRRWVRLLKAAGVRYRYQYQTRHTYASSRMSAGESAVDVAEALGHLDARLVDVVYSRFVPLDGRKRGERTIERFTPEWTLVSAILADNQDVLTSEDLADESVPDEVLGAAGEGDEDDLLDKLDSAGG